MDANSLMVGVGIAACLAADILYEYPGAVLCRYLHHLPGVTSPGPASWYDDGLCSRAGCTFYDLGCDVGIQAVGDEKV